jgi:hypothetical protein
VLLAPQYLEGCIRRRCGQAVPKKKVRSSRFFGHHFAVWLSTLGFPAVLTDERAINVVTACDKVRHVIAAICASAVVSTRSPTSGGIQFGLLSRSTSNGTLDRYGLFLPAAWL